MTGVAIAQWIPHPECPPADIDQLAELLHLSVHAGASVSFILPFSLDEARAFWRDKIQPAAASGARHVLIARRDTQIVGTVQLILDSPPNQRHRAEVAKLLVHTDARRLGIARALMTAVEEVARTERRTLLTLDTRTGDRAESLYVAMGYVSAGVIPNYARGPASPELEATTVMYKIVT